MGGASSAGAPVGDILAEIVAGTSATGQAFFESLVLCLSRALGVRYAMVAELVDDDTVRTLGYSADGALQPPCTYSLVGTPCASVAGGEVCYYAADVAARFPDDVMLREMDAASYLGVPLRSSLGEPLGILVVLHDRPIEGAVDPTVILQIFAGRAGAEIERLHHERELERRGEALRRSEELFSKVFRASPASTSISDLETGEIVDVNDAFTRSRGFRRDEVVGRRAVDVGLWDDTAGREAFVERVRRDGSVRDVLFDAPGPQGRRLMLRAAAEVLEIDGCRYLLTLAENVTERYHAELALKRSEERLRLALDAARMGAWDWMPASGTVGWSDRENRVCGFREGTAIARFDDYLARVHPEDAPVLRQAVDEALAGVRDPYVCEHRVLQPDGSFRWVEGRGQVSRDSQGRPVRLAGTVADIDDRKRTQAELLAGQERLRRSEEMFSRIFRSCPAPMIIARTGKRGIVDVNDAMIETFGIPREQIIGRTGIELGLWQEAQRAELVDALVREGRVRHVPVEIETPRGRRSLLLSGEMIEIAEEPHYLVMAIDITEWLQADRRLSQSAREWNECVDAMPAGLAIADGTGHVLRANRRILEWSGCASFKDLMGRTFADLGPDEPWPALARLACGHDREGVSQEVRAASSGRTWRIAWSAFPTAPGEAPATILVVREVTEEIRLRDDLRRQETLAAMGSLVAGVAHEVRTPLFSISATLDAFEGGTPEEIEEGTRLLRAQVKRLSALMSDLLDYGRPPALQLEAGGVGEIAERACRACAELANAAGVAVQLTRPELEPRVRRDGRRLEQALQNLVANAIQHSPRGAAVRVVLAESEGALECRVEDEGPGIAEDALPRVFEPFFTRRKGGTGLGLSIVQKTMEAHGGRVTAANRPGGGAVFTLTLPASAPEAAHA
jgi:PAS domain S-box-containing protein